MNENRHPTKRTVKYQNTKDKKKLPKRKRFWMTELESEHHWNSQQKQDNRAKPSKSYTKIISNLHFYTQANKL